MFKLIFFGTPEFSVPILNKIYQSKYCIKCVYTQPPRKSHRGQKIKKSSVHKLSDFLNLNVRSPFNLKNNLEEYNYINKLNADIAIVVAYGQIIPKNFLNLTKKGFINIHASLLPKYRGAAPIQRAIMNLEKKTGISIMKINDKLDSGPISNKYEIEIKKNDNFLSLSKKLSKIGSEVIIKNIDQILLDKVNFENQKEIEASYAKKILKSEGKINWKETAKKISAKVKGLNPHPGAWFIYKNERYKILKSTTLNLNGEPGLVLDNKLSIACGKGSIKVEEIQRQGKKPQNTNDFMMGSVIRKGCVLYNE